MAIKKNKKEDVLFEVDGFKVYANSEYRVENKIDRTVMKELVALGTSKYPGASETIFCTFSKRGNVYDTGFFESSPMYLGRDRVDIKETVRARTENILNPYLQKSGKGNGAFGPSDTVGWDGLPVTLYEGRIFNTNDPYHVMELYLALSGKKLAPAEFEENSDYMNASFKVVNTSENNVKKLTSELKDMEVDSTFYALFKNDKQTLIEIFTYIDGVKISNKPSEDLLLGVFKTVVKTSVNRTDKFLEVYEKIQDDNGRVEVKLNYIIDKGLNEKNEDFSKKGGMIFYKGTEIGKTSKDAADRIANSNVKEVLAIKDSLIFSAK